MLRITNLLVYRSTEEPITEYRLPGPWCIRRISSRLCPSYTGATRCPFHRWRSLTKWEPGRSRVGQKSEATNSFPQFSQVLTTDLQNFSTRRYRRKFAVNWLLKTPPHVAALPCETLVSKNKLLMINYKATGAKQPRRSTFDSKSQKWVKSYLSQQTFQIKSYLFATNRRNETQRKERIGLCRQDTKAVWNCTITRAFCCFGCQRVSAFYSIAYILLHIRLCWPLCAFINYIIFILLTFGPRGSLPQKIQGSSAILLLRPGAENPVTPLTACAGVTAGPRTLAW